MSVLDVEKISPLLKRIRKQRDKNKVKPSSKDKERFRKIKNKIKKNSKY